jgi:phenylacetate-CoA ligase
MYRTLYQNARVDIAQLADLRNLPILDADFLRAQELSAYTSGLLKNEDAILWGTSGSSGTPFQFYQTREDAIKWQLTFFRLLLVNGFKLWWRVAAIMRHSPDQNPSLISRLLTFRKNIVPISLPVEKQVDILRQLNPEMIYGITPAMEIIADWMIRENKGIHSAKIVLGMGITPTSEAAKKLQSAFGEKALVISGYGANDVGSIGFFCSRCNLFHFEDDQVITEIVDDKNNPIANGGTGRILITALDKFATPLIRYDIGDLIKMPDKPKKCKIKFKQFEAIAGRETDKLTLKDGSKIAYVHLWNVTRHLKNVKMIQFYQEKEGAVIIKYVPALNACTAEIENYILEKLPYRDQIIYSFQIVADIPLEKSGKRKLLKRAG